MYIRLNFLLKFILNLDVKIRSNGEDLGYLGFEGLLFKWEGKCIKVSYIFVFGLYFLDVC